jgi:pimeloyl-ACP methyl ester carboxylesterase
MRILVRAAILLALFIASLPGGAYAGVASPLEGAWTGTLSAQGVSLRVVFHFAQTQDGQWKGTLDSPDQGAAGLPLDVLTLNDKAVHCEINSVMGSFDGTLTGDGKHITGTWSQLGRSLPLNLEPVTPQALEGPRRPQEPSQPYPYRAQDVVLDNPVAGIQLAGTLTKPRAPGPFPAVLLIAGSGPNDRNEVVAGHKIFLVLANALTLRGIAVLRVDKRGVGLSKGDYRSATTQDFVSDALAAVVYLRKQPDIDARHIGLIGHSEGAAVAPAVAGRSSDVAFLVLLGAPAVRGDEILERQGELIRGTEGGHSAAFNAFRSAVEKGLIEAVEQEADDASALKRMHEQWAVQKAKLPTSGLSEPEQQEVGRLDPVLDATMKQMVAPWMRYFLTYDPAPALRELRRPVLVLYGSLDLQVPPAQNRQAMEAALRSDKDHTVMEVPGLNHLLQPASTGSPMEYQKIETTIDPRALQLIGDWVLRHAGQTHRGAPATARAAR